MWLLSRKGLQPPEVAEEVYADLKTLYMMLEELLVSKGSVKINHKSVNLLHHKNSCPCNKVTHFLQHGNYVWKRKVWFIDFVLSGWMFSTFPDTNWRCNTSASWSISSKSSISPKWSRWVPKVLVSCKKGHRTEARPMVWVSKIFYMEFQKYLFVMEKWNSVDWRH